MMSTNGAGAPEPWELGPPDENDDAPKPITLLDGPAIAAPLPELHYLVREIALVGGGGAPHLVAGYGFSGKTLALQAMGIALAAGVPIWGAYRVPDKRRVLHVDLEQGDRLTRARYQRLARAMGIDLPELCDDLALAVMPPLTLSVGCESRWKEIMASRDLMFVDSLRAATGGQDENSSEIRAGLDMLGHLSEETGCRAIVVHHARKPSQDDPGGRYTIRGSGAIYDGSDSVYLFAASKGEPVRVEHLKARTHGELVDDCALVIADVELDGDPRAGLSVTVSGAELIDEQRTAKRQAKQDATARADAQALRNALARSPGLGTRELRAKLALSGDRLALAIAHLGPAIRTEEHASGRTRTTRHYVTGGRVE